MRIFLVGYMGSGKSTVGRLLADHLDVPFIDTDNYIEEAGRSISDIFAEEGQAHFRSLESQAIAAIINHHPDHIVISTGGGLPCNDDMMDRLTSAGRVVYLKTSIATIAERLQASSDRPLVEQHQGRSLLRYIQQHLGSRRPYYRRADVIVWSKGPIERVVQRIIRKLRI
jgi:shikimate kinase